MPPMEQGCFGTATLIERSNAKGRTVTLKMKYTDFQTVTRAKSVPDPISGKGQFAGIAQALLDELLPLPLPIRFGLQLTCRIKRFWMKCSGFQAYFSH